MTESSSKSRPPVAPQIPALRDELPIDLGAFVSPLTAAAADYVGSPVVAEQLPVIFWLSEELQPQVVVVLGATDATVHFGVCQALGASALEAKCFLGDALADAAMHDSWLSYESQRHAARSRIVGGDTGDLLEELGEAAVDLLVLHLESATSDQLQDWKTRLLPKVSSRGIILLDGLGNGSSAVYDQFQSTGPAFRFWHGSGFAIIAPGEDPPALVKYLAKQDEIPAHVDLIRGFFKQLGLGCRQPADRREIALEQTGGSWAARLVSYEAKIEDLTRRLEWHREELDSATGKRNSPSAGESDGDLVSGLQEAERKLRASRTEIGEIRRAHDERIAQISRSSAAKITGLQAEFKSREEALEAETGHLEARIGDLEAEILGARDEAERHKDKLLDDLAELTRISEEWRSRANDRQAETEELLFKVRMQRRARHAATKKLRSRARQAEKDLVKARREATKWKMTAAELEKQIADVLSSTSWRATRPIRAVKRIFTRQNDGR